MHIFRWRWLSLLQRRGGVECPFVVRPWSDHEPLVTYLNDGNEYLVSTAILNSLRTWVLFIHSNALTSLFLTKEKASSDFIWNVDHEPRQFSGFSLILWIVLPLITNSISVGEPRHIDKEQHFDCFRVKFMLYRGKYCNVIHDTLMCTFIPCDQIKVIREWHTDVTCSVKVITILILDRL